MERKDGLINPLQSTDRTVLLENLSALADEYHRSDVRSRTPDSVATIALKNKELLVLLIKLIKEHGKESHLGSLAFWSVRSVGPDAFPLIREEWEGKDETLALSRLHICMMDILGSCGNFPDQTQRMKTVAKQEIPLWISLMKNKSPPFREWIIWLLTDMWEFAPGHAPQLYREIANEIDKIESGSAFGTFLRNRAQETLIKLKPFVE